MFSNYFGVPVTVWTWNGLGLLVAVDLFLGDDMGMWAFFKIVILDEVEDRALSIGRGVMMFCFMHGEDDIEEE